MSVKVSFSVVLCGPIHDQTSIYSKTTQSQASRDENRGALFIKIITVISRKSKETFHPIGKWMGCQRCLSDVCRITFNNNSDLNHCPIYVLKYLSWFNMLITHSPKKNWVSKCSCFCYYCPVVKQVREANLITLQIFNNSLEFFSVVLQGCVSHLGLFC